MKNRLDKSEVAHVAHLARLEVNDAEMEKYSRELSPILDYVAKIQELETADIPATFQVLPRTNVFRQDESAESLSVEEALSNAPQREADYFKMPKILEGGD